MPTLPDVLVNDLHLRLLARGEILGTDFTSVVVVSHALLGIGKRSGIIVGSQEEFDLGVLIVGVEMGSALGFGDDLIADDANIFCGCGHVGHGCWAVNDGWLMG